MRNHFINNLLTKGVLGISKPTVGFISYNIYTKYGRKTGSGDYAKLKKEYKKYEDDTDYIEVFIDWEEVKDKTKYGKEIYVQYIKKEITADLIKENSNKNIDINVKLLN